MAIWEYVHNTFGIHIWDLPALVMLIASVAAGLTHWYRQRRRYEEHMERLEGLERHGDIDHQAVTAGIVDRAAA